MSQAKEVATIRDRIIRYYQPDKIILFGSCAREDATETSDVDILVISDREKDLPRSRRGLEVRLKLTDLQRPKDILFYTHADVKKWEEVPQSFVFTVLREGKVLYER